VRWPLLLAILLAVIAALYRYGPNVRHTWRQCLPGAALAVLLWVGAAALFRATQGSDGADGPGLDEDDEGFPHCPPGCILCRRRCEGQPKGVAAELRRARRRNRFSPLGGR
jgi:hypothetical protein